MIPSSLFNELCNEFTDLKIILNNTLFNPQNITQKKGFPLLEITLLSNETFVYENEMVYPLKQTFKCLVTTENKKANTQIDTALLLASHIADTCKRQSNEWHLYNGQHLLPFESENVHESKCAFVLIKRDLVIEPFT